MACQHTTPRTTSRDRLDTNSQLEKEGQLRFMAFSTKLSAAGEFPASFRRTREFRLLRSLRLETLTLPLPDQSIVSVVTCCSPIVSVVANSPTQPPQSGLTLRLSQLPPLNPSAIPAETFCGDRSL